MSIEIRGDKQLLKALMQAKKLDDAKKVVKNNTALLTNKAQRKAPVDTGALRRSITMEMGDGGLTGKVTPAMEYAPYVEYGTRFMDAQPFMRPAFEEVKDKYLRELEELTK